jgi:hypothetical protein
MDKDYLKNRNSRIMRDLEFNEGILFKNFTHMPKTNYYILLGIVEPILQNRILVSENQCLLE